MSHTRVLPEFIVDPVIKSIVLRTDMMVREMEGRFIHCPYCDFKAEYVYANCRQGVMRLKCPRCKKLSNIDLAYFKSKRKLKN